MAFLSLLDDRARPKGSRDPLGFEMVWTHFGRQVVGNLTTITSSWRIFSVGLLGFYWCNKLCHDTHPEEKQKKLQEHFIRYEQLAAYLRSSAGDDDIMGITRVRKNLKTPAKTVRISTEQQDLILSDQVSYGIWGLYSTALRETGLIRGDYRELTERGLEVVRLIEKGLTGTSGQCDSAWCWQFLQGKKNKIKISDLKLEGEHFVKAVTSKKVKKTLIAALMQGSGGHACQLDLYNTCRVLPKEVLKGESIKRGGIGPLVAAIREKSNSDELSQALDNISQVERLLVTANKLFDYLRLKDGEPLLRIAEIVHQDYSFDYIAAGPEFRSVPYGADLEVLRNHLKGGNTLAALRCLLGMNKKIMAGRGGAAWVEESGDGKLRVRVKAEKASLPKQEKLQSRWDYDYFLRSYARIAAMEKR